MSNPSRFPTSPLRALVLGALAAILICPPSALATWATFETASPAASKLYWGSNAGFSVGTVDAVGNGADGRNLITSAGIPSGTVVDAAAGKIYWIDADGDEPTIRYANLDGTGDGTLSTTGALVDTTAKGLALDPATGTLYWALFDTIQYAKIDGSGGGTLYSNSSAYRGAFNLTLDSASNRIYLIKFNDVYYLNLDGTPGSATTVDPACLVSMNVDNRLNFGTGVLVDSAADTLYVSGSMGSNRGFAVWEMRLDGSQCTQIANQSFFPAMYGMSGQLGLTFDPTANRLIWADDNLPALWWLSLTDSTVGTYRTGTANLQESRFPTALAVPAAAPPVVTPASSTAGATLACSAPTWSSRPGMNVAQLPATGNTYGWSRDGVPVAGATEAQLVTTVGGSYACTVSASNGAGTGTTTSAAVTVNSVPADPATPAAPATPAVSVPAPAATATGAKPKVMRRSGIISISVTATGPGTVQVTGTVISRSRAAANTDTVISRSHAAANACIARATFVTAGTKTLRCIPTAATQRLRKKGPVKIGLSASFTPTSGKTTRITLDTVILAKITTRPPAPVTG